METRLMPHIIEDMKQTITDPNIYLGIVKIKEDKLSDIKEVNNIVKIVCFYFQVDLSGLTENKQCRKQEYVKTRQLLHFFLRYCTKLNLVDIGKLIGDKDHATVLHSCKIVSNLYDTDKDYKHDFDYIANLIKLYVQNMQRGRMYSTSILKPILPKSRMEALFQEDPNKTKAEKVCLSIFLQDANQSSRLQKIERGKREVPQECR